MSNNSHTVLLIAAISASTEAEHPRFLALEWTRALQDRLAELTELVREHELAMAAIFWGCNYDEDDAQDAFGIDCEQIVVQRHAVYFRCTPSALEGITFEAGLGLLEQLNSRAEEAQATGRRYFLGSAEGLAADEIAAFVERFDAALEAEATLDAALISEADFVEVWGATAAASGDLLGRADVVHLPLNTVWTVVEVEDDWIACPGFHVVSKLGYLTTTKPWDDATPDAFWAKGI